MKRTLSLGLGSLLLAGVSAAQGSTIPFTLDGAASQFTYSGTTSVGPVVGNPASFGLSGTVDARLSAGLIGSPIGSIQFVPTGSALVAPDINASIPNPFPFLPPLATISITGLRLALVSDALPVDLAGAFSGMVVSVALSGTLTVDPITGATTVTDLTGSDTDPQLASGVVSLSASVITLAAPLNLPFALSDPASGLSGTVDLVGMVVGDYATPPISNYCAVAANSSGAPALIGASGSTSLSSADLELLGSALPQNSVGFFLFAGDQGFVPGFGGSSGNLCIGGQLFRLSNFVLSSGSAGQVSLPLPYGALPAGIVFDIGDSWNFQYWFRDAVGGAPTSNTTGGLNVTFAP